MFVDGAPVDRAPGRRARPRHRDGVPGHAPGPGAHRRGEHRARPAGRPDAAAQAARGADHEASRDYGLAVDPTARVRHLSIGERQRVEILKVLMTGARLVILDEPTSVLAPQEVDALFGVVDAAARPRASAWSSSRTSSARSARSPTGSPCCAAARSILDGGRPGTTDRRRAGRGDGRPERAAAAPSERVALPERARAALELQRRRPRSATAGKLALKGVDLDVRPGRARRGRRRRRQRPAGAVRGGPRAAPRRRRGDRPGRRPVGRTAAPDAIDGWRASRVPEDPVADSVVPGLTSLEHMVLDGRARTAARRSASTGAAVGARTAELDERVGLRIAAGEPPRLDALGRQHPAGPADPRSSAQDAPLVVAAYPSRGLDVANTRRTQELLLERATAGAGVLHGLGGPRRAASRWPTGSLVMHDGHIAGDRRHRRRRPHDDRAC